MLRHLANHTAALALLTGCPSGGDDGGDGPCAGGGDITAIAQPNRLDTDPIEDGSEIPVFPPPQGGVFTELDVRIAGVASEDLELLRVRIEDDTGQQLANVQYRGDGLPLMCEDDRLVVFNLPVGFDLDTMLQALDGVSATLLLGVDTVETTVEQTWSVTLRITS